MGSMSDPADNPFPWPDLSVPRQVSPDDPSWVLCERICERRAELDALAAEVADGSRFDPVEMIYRFWHQSFKVFYLQSHTVRIDEMFKELCPPGAELSPWFRELIDEGTGLVFDLSMNDTWSRSVRPIVDAFLHARFLLDRVREVTMEDATARIISYPYATVLELFSLR